MMDDKLKPYKNVNITSVGPNHQLTEVFYDPDKFCLHVPYALQDEAVELMESQNQSAGIFAMNKAGLDLNEFSQKAITALEGAGLFWWASEKEDDKGQLFSSFHIRAVEDSYTFIDYVDPLGSMDHAVFSAVWHKLPQVDEWQYWDKIPERLAEIKNIMPELKRKFSFIYWGVE